MSNNQTPNTNTKSLADIEALLREVTEDDHTLTEPPADLWFDIEVEAFRDPDILHAEPLAPVIDLAERRKRRTMVALASAAATIIAVVGVMAITGGESLGPEVATADLAYDPVAFDALGADATATVSLHDADGTYRLTVDKSDLPDTATEAADLELWLIQPDADGNPAALVSLGLIDRSDPGSFDVPEGFDPNLFFVVDISVEPRDGDAGHSGRSILRGPLSSV